MILGYFTAPKNKQDDVLHTIGSVLNFSPTEFEKVRYIKNLLSNCLQKWWHGFGVLNQRKIKFS